MKTHQQVARTLFRLLEGELPSIAQRRQLQEWAVDIGSTVAGEVDAESLRQLLASQPRSTALRQYWQPVFHADNGPDAAQSWAFLHALVEMMEDLHGLAPAPIEAGITRAEAGRLMDVRVFRPAIKHGWSIQLTTEGIGEFNCVRQRIETESGDLILFAPSALYDYGRAARAPLWNHHWVYFQAQEHWYSLLRWSEVGPGIFHLAAGEDYAQLLALFDAICSARYSRRPLALRLAANLLEQLLIRCHLRVTEVDKPTDARIERTLTYISEHYGEALTVAAIARAAGLSPSRLSTLFKAQVGIAVLGYRDELRLNRACQLLADSALSITRVAEAVGYDDPQYFSRYFKRKLGVGPRAYRRQRLG